jgi:hypothetical protein
MNLWRKPMLVLLGGGPTWIISVYKSYFHAFRLFLEKQLTVVSSILMATILLYIYINNMILFIAKKEIIIDYIVSV